MFFVVVVVVVFFFPQNVLEKTYFIAKMSGPAGQFWLLESALI